MEAILNYALKASIGLLVLYLFYFALLRRQNNFPFNRIYLLLAPLVALLLPLLSWPAALAPEAAVTQTLQAIQLQEITVTTLRAQTDKALVTFTWPAILVGLYAFGILLVLGNLGRQLWQIRLVKKLATPARSAGEAQVYELSESLPSFAFGRSVFISQRSHLNTTEQEQVLAHELAHVHYGHTWDVLFYEALTALLWFHPAVWLMKQELRDVHEYQADAAVVQQYQAQKYTSLLSREALLSMGLPVGSHFNKPQVLKRLHMLQLRGQKYSLLRPVLTLPLLGALTFLLARPEATADAASVATASIVQPSEGLSENAAASQLPETTPPVADEAMPEQPAEAATLEKNTEADAPMQDNQPADVAKNLLYVKPYTEPYTYVEQMPTFSGGEAEMLKFLGTNIRYPKEAEEVGLEGLVVVSFVVGVDGSLSEAQVIKRLGMGTDEEAIRVVKMMDGKWQPGKQDGKAVPVRYTLPIRYAIR